ncbi:MAG TPA: S41 family peptidase [Burkholderiaceae bacterium]|jgi:C-terminal processing protease CtpA/Prc
MNEHQSKSGLRLRRLALAAGMLTGLAWPALHAQQAHAATAQAAFKRPAWQDDYAALKKAMERNYANLAWFASTELKLDLPALDRRTQAVLKAAHSDDEAREAIRRFKAAFPDGHFSIYPDPAPQKNAAAIEDPPEADLSHADGPTACAALGYTNGALDFSLPLPSLQGFRMESDGLATVLRTGVIDTAQGTKLGLIRLQSFNPQDYAAGCIKVWSALGAAGKERNSATVTDAVQNAWYAELAQVLKQFGQAHVAAVVVDVGNNHGGNDSGDISARIFTRRDVHSARLYLSNSAKARPELESQTKDVKEELAKVTNAEAREALQAALARLQAALAGIDAQTCDMSWVWHEMRPWNPDAACSRLVRAGSAGGPLDFLPENAYGDTDAAQTLHWPAAADGFRGAWNGPVYVLTDRKTFSSAEMFSAVMRDNGIAKTVGDRTGGDGCGFMGYHDPEVLPNSRMRIRMPNCIRLRADGTSEVAGVAPDLPVLPTPGESARARAARALALIADDLKRKEAAPGAMSAAPAK